MTPAWWDRQARDAAAFFVLLLGLLFATGHLFVSAGCKGVSVPTHNEVETGAAVATGVCSLIEGVEDSGIVRTICASVDEVAAIAQFILTLRTSDAGVMASAAACTPLPGSSICATSAERAKAILFVTKLRSSRLMLDAGAR